MLLPPPVGASTSASPPATTCRTTCSCWPRNPGKPNTRRNTAAGSSHASARTRGCNIGSVLAETDFHPPALLRGQRELHRAMAAQPQTLWLNAVGLQLVDHHLRAQIRQQDVRLFAAGGIGKAVDMRDVTRMRLCPLGCLTD